MTAVRLSLLSLAVVTLTGAGCAEVPPSTLYVLKAADPVVTDVARPANVVPLMVVLGPVTVPDYLDRTDIVRRASDNRLATADRERWGEPLRAGLQRVLAADLARGLGAAFWVATGADRAAQADIEVPVDLDSIHTSSRGLRSKPFGTPLTKRSTLW